jgi:hypothetical protein
MLCNDFNLSDDQYTTIIEVYNDLKEFNKGKSPSDHMKKLMDSLEDVVKELSNNEDGMINMTKLDKLNKYALKYYDKRQGIIFSPLTDDGQSRLASVGKLVRTTKKAVSEMRKANNELQTVQVGMGK